MTSSKLYSANMGVAQIGIANPNLNGTGAVTEVLTAASNGTVIRSITIKALETTAQGMVRFFIANGAVCPPSGMALFKEVPIPAVTISSVSPAFSITLNGGFNLEPGDSLYASTQNQQAFNIIIDGLDWSNCACS